MCRFFFKMLLLINVLVLSSSVTFPQFTWTKYPSNPLSIHGSSGSWDQSVFVPYVIFNSDANRYEMWYTALSGYPNGGIGFAYSSDGIAWTKNPTPVMTPGATGWDSLFVGAPCIIKESGGYKMWYTGWKSQTRLPHSIGYATSPNGINWTKQTNPVLTPGSGWEAVSVGYLSVIKVPGGYMMFYTGEVSFGIARTGRAFSTDGINWQRDLVYNPVLPAGGSGAWDQNNYLARVLEFNGALYLWYTAETNPGVTGTAIGLATSVDTGKTWTKYAGNPVLTRGTTGSWDNGWIETGSILLKDNTFKMWYDGGGSATSDQGRIGYATSTNVVPVELTAFTASAIGTEVILNWSTATELNNYGFEVQRKACEGDFATISFVKGQGTTTQKNEYSFADKNLDEGKYFYRLKQMDYGGQFSYSQIVEVDVRTLDNYTLEQNYPNPFNPTTTIGYVLQEKSNARLTLLNSLGEEIAVLINEEQDKGYHKVEFDGSKLSSGVYFYKLVANDFVSTKKMILLK